MFLCEAKQDQTTHSSHSYTIYALVGYDGFSPILTIRYLLQRLLLSSLYNDLLSMIYKENFFYYKKRWLPY